MNEFIMQYSSVWGDDPKQLMSEYNYNLALTEKLDSMDAEQFNREVLYEIILWKLNRFPSIEDNLLDELKTLSKLQQGEYRKTKDVLVKLFSWIPSKIFCKFLINITIVFQIFPRNTLSPFLHTKFSLF